MSAPDPQGRLAEAVEGLYDVFSRYPLVPRVGGCPCCVSDSDEALLHSKPLRELTADDLWRYAFKALSTWGTEEDFKHFLPRLFELVAAGTTIDEQLFHKLVYARPPWRQWPVQEQQAIEDYLDALWSYRLSLSPEVAWLDPLLWAYVEILDDLTPYLATGRT